MVPILEMIRRQVMQRIIERKRKANNLSQSELAKQYMFHVASGKSVVFHVNMHMVQYWRKKGGKKKKFPRSKGKEEEDDRFTKRNTWKGRTHYLQTSWTQGS